MYRSTKWWLKLYNSIKKHTRIDTLTICFFLSLNISNTHTQTLICPPTEMYFFAIPKLCPHYMTNHLIKCCPFRCTTLSSDYWFQIKAIFPLIYFRLVAVCFACAHTHIDTHTHFAPVINNLLMAILRLVTHSQPINQTIQAAYDHNKYALMIVLLYHRWYFYSAVGKK